MGFVPPWPTAEFSDRRRSRGKADGLARRVRSGPERARPRRSSIGRMGTARQTEARLTIVFAIKIL